MSSCSRVSGGFTAAALALALPAVATAFVSINHQGHAAPQIQVTPATVTATVQARTTGTASASVANAGSGLLGVSAIQARGFGASQITSIALPPRLLMTYALDEDSGFMYGKYAGDPGFARYNPETNTWTPLADAPTASASGQYGSAVAGGKVFVADSSLGQMGIYTIAANTWNATPVHFSGPVRVAAATDTHVYAAAGTEFARYSLTTGTWETLTTAPKAVNENSGMACHAGHVYLLLYNQKPNFYRYSIAEGTWEALPQAPSQAWATLAVDPDDAVLYTYDGSNLGRFSLETGQWLPTINHGSDYGWQKTLVYRKGRLYGYNHWVNSQTHSRIDLGGWMSVGPESAELNTGESASLSVTLDGRPFNESEQEGYLLFVSNDPVTPRVRVPVRMSVDGEPELSLDSAVMDFGKVYVGGSQTKSVTIRNRGTAPLVTTATAASARLSLNPVTRTVNPGGSYIFQATYTPTEDEDLAETITIESNDPVHPAGEIAATGLGRRPPRLEVDPPSLSLTLDSGTTAAREIRLHNAGHNDLTVTLTNPHGNGARYYTVTPRNLVIAAGTTETATVVFNGGGYDQDTTETRLLYIYTDAPGQSLIQYQMTWHIVLVTPPGPPSGPSPSNGAINITPATNFSWNAPAEALTCDLYLWRDGDTTPTQPTVADLTSNSWNPSTDLAGSTDYRWQVVTKNRAGSAAGPVWRFRTRSVADYEVVSVDAPTTAVSGQPITVEWTVRNNGPEYGYGGNWSDYIYLSPSPVYNSSSTTYLGLAGRPVNLGPEESYTTSHTVTLPENVSGAYWIHVYADRSNNVYEANEANNIGVTDEPVTITLAEKSNLAVGAVQPLTPAMAGQPMEVAVRTVNSGTGRTTVQTYTELLISSNATYESGDTRLGYVTVPRHLPAGSDSWSTTTVTLPASLTAGTWHLIARADHYGNEPESDEGDNTLSQAITVAVPDCNGNGIPDAVEIANGTVRDCNGNKIPDSCELADGSQTDCDNNGFLDVCDIREGRATDCNGNRIPDSCDLASGTEQDCDGNGIPDRCDIAAGRLQDCNRNGLVDACELADGLAADCNGNGIPDSCDIASRTSRDSNSNGIPDECEIDYTVTASTTATRVLLGTPVLITGEARLAQNQAPAARKPVRVRVTARGTDRYLSAVTDDEGRFSAWFSPLPLEAGHYAINGLHPLEQSEETEDTFSIVGMKVDPKTSTHRMVTGTPYTVTMTLKNLGQEPLTGLDYTFDNTPGVLQTTVTLPSTLGPDEQTTFAVTFLTDDPALRRPAPRLTITSAQGATAQADFALTILPATPELAATPGFLRAGMVRGDQTDVEFEVSNVGGAPARDLRVLLPSREAAPWLHLVTSSTLGTLEPGQKAVVRLQLLPSATLDLVPYSGNLVIQGSNTFLSLNYQFTAVSNRTGDLKVDCVDEVTLNTPGGGPGVEGATVTVTNPNDSTVVATGTADTSGTVNFASLPEGYYVVTCTAPRHSSYRSTIFLQGSQQKHVRAFMPRDLVTYRWTVRPTLIPDRYIITLESTFETNVPAPVVTIEPAYIDLAQMTSATAQIDFKITNHGLIKAEGVKLNVQSTERYTLNPLVTELGDLPASSTLTVPVTIVDNEFAGAITAADKRRMAAVAESKNVTLVSTGDPYAEDAEGSDMAGLARARGAARAAVSCGVAPVTGVYYSYVCGEDQRYRVQPVTFTIPRVPGCGFDLGKPEGEGIKVPWPVWDPWKYEYGPGTGTVHNPTWPERELGIDGYCDPCLNSLGGTGGGCSGLGGNGQVGRAGDCGSGMGGGMNNCLGGGGAASLQTASPLAPVSYIYDKSTGVMTAATGDSRLEAIRDEMALVTERLRLIGEGEVALLGDEAWINLADASGNAAREIFLTAFSTAGTPDSDGGERISDAEREALLALPLPAPLTAAHAEKLISRWNRTIDYRAEGIVNAADLPAGHDPDFIAQDVLTEKREAAEAARNADRAEGYMEVLDHYHAVFQKLDNYLVSKQSDGVCAKVKIQIEQEAVVQRQAFEARLEIENNDASELTGIRVVLDIRDEEGNLASDRFAVRPVVLGGALTGTDGTGRLPAGAAGSALYTLIPTQDAAPLGPTRYRVGGHLTYVLDGAPISAQLFPDTITVLPDPKLRFDYFQAREVYSDDPFTTDVVEPAEPFDLALIVKNLGRGTARSLTITSAQPKIIENEKGLLIDFQIIGSQVNRELANASLTARLGDIASGQTAVARWIMTASLQGTFVDYKATFQHQDAIGDARISLIDSVDIHELVHTVRAQDPSDDGMPDFLVNDEADADALPDTVYFSDGTSTVVNAVLNGTVDALVGPRRLAVELSAPAVPTGWVYFQIPDPGLGQFRLAEVRRSDGKVIRVGDNAWLTSRRKRQGGRTVMEDRFHLFDFASTGRYTLVFSPTSEADLAVVKSAPRNVLSGSDLTYQIAVINRGPAPATGVVLSDDLPTSVTFISADPAPSLTSGPLLQWNLNPLAVGESTTVTLVVHPHETGELMNTASVAGNQFDSTPADNTSRAVTGIGEPVALSLAKTADVAVLDRATSLTYTITVTNSGGNPARNVTITDELPDALALDALVADIPGATAGSAGRTVTVFIPSLEAGASAQFRIVASALRPGVITNTAAVATTDFDSDLTDNESSVTVTVTNAAPVAGPDPDAVGFEDEDVTVTLSGTDPDNDPLTALVTALPTSGTLYQVALDGGRGDTITSVPATVTDLLGRVIYASSVPDGHGTPWDAFTFAVTDGYDTSEASTATVSLLAVNDAPVVTVPADVIRVPRGQTASIGGVSISDVDAGTSDLLVHLTTGMGTLSVAAADGLTFLVGDGQEDAAMTFAGTREAVNAALAGLVFAPEDGFLGTAAIAVTADDQGATGLGGARTGTAVVAVEVLPVADLGVTVSAAPATVSHGRELTFTAVAHNAGPDACGVTTLTQLLTPGAEIVSAGATAGTVVIEGDELTFALGDLAPFGSATATVVVRYAVPRNAATTVTLQGSVHDPAPGDNRASAEAEVVNSVPVAEPGAADGFEDQDVMVTLSGTDEDDDPLTATITALPTTGTLYQVAAGGGRGARITDVPADVTDPSGRVLFAPLPDTHAPSLYASFSFAVRDALSQSEPAAVVIRLAAVNDPPTVTVPAGPLTVIQETDALLTGISVADPDADESEGDVQVTLTVTTGTISLDTEGLTVVSGAPASGSVTVRGRLDAVNGALAGLIYRSASWYRGADLLAVEVSDLGNTGAGGALTASAAVALDVVDVTAPASEVIGPVGRVLHSSAAIPVTFTVTDPAAGTPSGFRAVTLWVRAGSDPSAPFVQYGGEHPRSPIAFDAESMGGVGTYALYTRAVDHAGNMEEAPASPDVVFTVEPAADLSVTVTPDVNPATFADDLTLRIAVTNRGPDPATSVTVLTVIPGGWAYHSGSATQGTVEHDGVGTTVTAVLGTLAPDAAATVTLTGLVTTTESLAFAAGVFAAEEDPAPADNAAETAVSVRQFVPYTSDDYSVPGGESWLPMGGTGHPAQASFEHSTTAGAWLARIALDPSLPRPLVVGGYTGESGLLPYAQVGPGNYVRAKFYVYAGGQTGARPEMAIPALRLRAATRFAVTSILEVFSHLNMDPGNTSVSLELRPSSDPDRPSLYRVDFDPVDVPFLEENGETEGILRAFEAYSLDPQDHGYLALTESVIGTYAAAALPDSVAPVKVYAPGAADAGDLALRGEPGTSTDLTTGVYVWPPASGMELVPVHDPVTSRPVYTEGAFGVTLDTMAVPAGRLAFLAREFNPGDDPSAPDYLRVQPEKLYKVRFHLTSTQQASRNAMIRLRGRAAKFAWIQRYEIGGAFAAGDQNNTIAQQALPGIGSLNPDRDGHENGGWYTMLMHSPLSAGIRPEFADGTPVSERMPILSAEPGPGSPAAGRRDLQFGLDLIDTLSLGGYRGLERGHVTLDRIEVREYDPIED